MKMRSNIVCGLVFVCLVNFVVYTSSKRLPSYITRCRAKDPAFNQCIKEQMKNNIPRYAQGLPELGIPPFDPMFIPRAEFQQKLKANALFKGDFTNITMTGLKDAQVNDLDFDINNVHFNVTMFFPYILFVGDYKSEGKFLTIPFHGSGRFNTTLENVEVSVSMKGEHVTRNGKKYISLFDEKFVTLKETGGSVYFENVFGNNKDFSDNLNRVFNENIKDLLDELRPVREEVTGGLIFGIIKRAIDKYSMDELFTID